MKIEMEIWVQSFGIGFENSFMQIIGIAIKEIQNKGIGMKLLQYTES